MQSSLGPLLQSLRLDYESIHLRNCLRPSANLDYLSIVVVDELLRGIKDLQASLRLPVKLLIKLFHGVKAKQRNCSSVRGFLKDFRRFLLEAHIVQATKR